MSYAMSRAEREQFLAQPHVGVVSVMENGAPLTVPVWYGYQPGRPVVVITGRESRKVQAVRAADHTIFIAEVVAARRRHGDPLLYHNRGYRTLYDPERTLRCLSS